MSRPIALITGGTSGIGYAIARKLVSTHDLALIFRNNQARAEAAKERLEKSSSLASVRVFPAELMGHEDCQKVYALLVREMKGSPEILIHSAGRIRPNLFVASGFSEIEAMVKEHLIVAMALSQLVLPAMYKNKSGRILFLGSTAAQCPAPGQASYAAAKAALEGFTRALSLEVSHRGITINCIAPGLTETPLAEETIAMLKANGSPRNSAIALPEDVADVAAFLCSGEAGHLSGRVFSVHAGTKPAKA